jgi:flavodoxin
MSDKKTLIICHSFHHHNTLKIAKTIAKELNADIKKPSEIQPKDTNKYDLIGFGSGIYDDKHHKTILNFADKLPIQKGKKTFTFSTSGTPIKITGGKFFNNYTQKCTNVLKEKLTIKQLKVIGDFCCPGFNTNIFLKYIGGINKNRPNADDLKEAKKFALKLKNNL